MAVADNPSPAAVIEHVEYVNQVFTAAQEITIKAAVAGKRFRLVQFNVSTNASTSIYFQSNSTIVYPERMAGNAGASGDFNSAGWMETAIGEALTMESTAAATVGASLRIWEIG